MEMEEKVFYVDDDVKITDLRVSCNHVTIPLERIGQVSSVLCVNSLIAAVTVFAISLMLFILGGDSLHMRILGVVVFTLSLYWLMSVFANYAKVMIMVEGETIPLLTVAVNRKEYAFQVADEIAKALISFRGMESERLKMALPSGGVMGLRPSETMMLRSMLHEAKKRTKDEGDAEAAEPTPERVAPTAESAGDDPSDKSRKGKKDKKDKKGKKKKKK